MSADANSAFHKKLSSTLQAKSTWIQPDAAETVPNYPDSSSSYAYPQDLSPASPPYPLHNQAQLGQHPSGTWRTSRSLVQRFGLEERFAELRQGVLFRDQLTPLRLAGHLSVLFVAAMILFLSQYDFPDLELSLRSIPQNTLTNDASSPATLRVAGAVTALGQDMAINDESLQRAAVPFTVKQERGRTTIETYNVSPGDTVLGIAAKFGLQPETIQWSNSAIEQNPDLLQIGDELKILPMDGVLHTVVNGDTLSSLAAKYKTDVEAIIGFEGNALTDAAQALIIGQEIVVPNGIKPYVPRTVVAYSAPVPSSAVKGTGNFVWPVSGSISQQYWGGHRAIDVGSWTGAPVKSADSGYVVIAGGGWNGGYGNHVIIDHGNGFVTLYAHLNSIFVRPGENVARGQQVGTVGNTGNSTGPHLHFEVRYQGTPRNPFSYLP